MTDATTYFDAEGNSISLDDLQESSMITVQTDEDNQAISVTLSNDNFEMGAPGNNQSAPTSYTASNHYTDNTQLSGETLTSTGTDENAALITDGASVSLDEMTITRTSADSTIISQQDTSGGIHVAGGGTLYASNLTVETNGESAAAIRSDRGGGTMTVDGGTYTSKGSGSPAIYCTADITVENANLIAEGSEAICIEGLNQLSLTDCNLTGNMPDLSQNDCTFTAESQTMNGDILWDSISTLDFVITENSSLTGAFIQDESAVQESGDGYANLSIDETSTWIVTGNSTLNTLTNQGTIVDENNNAVTIQGTDGTVYAEGTSSYTITVSNYNTK